MSVTLLVNFSISGCIYGYNMIGTIIIRVHNLSFLVILKDLPEWLWLSILNLGSGYLVIILTA